MIPGLYTAASSLMAGEKNQEVIAQNLSHTNVPGYRRQFLVQSAHLGSVGRADDNPRISITQAKEIGVDHTFGGVEQTGRPLDMAIAGDGFFELTGPKEPYYTRNGSFQVDGTGQLVSSTGLPVAGTGGPILIGTNTAPGSISIDKTGTVYVGGAARGKVKVVQFADKRQLKPVGSTAFTTTAEPTTAKDFEIVQGSRELSNVRTVDELVRMIVGMRQYQAAEKTLQTIGDSLQHHIDS